MDILPKILPLVSPIDGGISKVLSVGIVVRDPYVGIGIVDI